MNSHLLARHTAIDRTIGNLVSAGMLIDPDEIAGHMAYLSELDDGILALELVASRKCYESYLEIDGINRRDRFMPGFTMEVLR